MKVLFATAELRPLVSAGGLGEAAFGLVAELRELDVEVVTALPDYSGWDLEAEQTMSLVVPDWAAPATVRVGRHPDAGQLALVDIPGIARPDPYVDEEGVGWPDNDLRFGRFSVALAALASELDADLVHINDWHTSFVPAFLADEIPSVLTIHNLAHQGWAGSEWLPRLAEAGVHYQWEGNINPLAGAVRLVDKVVTVSPTYAAEIVKPEGGAGLDELLTVRGSDLVGIRNGIDAATWNPALDLHAPRYSADDLAGKARARAELLRRVGWADTGHPLVVMVSRLVDQKGVDLAFEAARFLDGMGARMIVLGSGEPRFGDWGRWLAGSQPNVFWFHDGYDAPLSHLLFAGGDLLLMPSRFEPCGLAQMQAMAYGAIPVVTGVGGLVDTVIDADRSPSGNGFVAKTIDESGVVDALHRALRAWWHAERRRTLQQRGMREDWSWSSPAAEYVDLYRSLR